MPPRREHFETKDRRSYTLWADINDLMSAVMPAYWSDDRDHRRERGWMFRGQANSEWDLIPSLYRPPLNDTILKARQDYTEEFVGALQKEALRFGIDKLTDSEYLAIAQHYGFYTPLLDFSWNVEVAAYFATLGGRPGQIGAIFAFNAQEYKEMRNPFAALGVSIEFSDSALKNAGMEPLPDLGLVELYNVPRIYEQEGIFIRITPEKVETLMHECIDRFYFRQRSDTVYMGSFPHRAHLLPSSRDFDSPETYDAFMELVRKERPDLLENTRSFEKDTLFPPADLLSRFAENWKQEHSDRTSNVKNKNGSQSHVTTCHASSFSKQVESYYYGEFADSPYKHEYLLEGRQLVEFLLDYDELDDLATQRWLLWELLNRTLPSGLPCTLKLGNASTWDSQQEGFRFIVVDRWLADSYNYTLSQEQLQKGFCRVIFGPLSPRGRPVVKLSEADPFTPPASFRTPVPSNPHKCSVATSVLHAIESRLVGIDEGIVGSFLYDLHNVVMVAMGRNLELTVGLVESAPCLQRSPLVHPEHVDGPALLVRLFDRFTGGVTHTAVCAKHWDHMSEADVDLMRPQPWILLGLA
jgi:hypothetical protein